MEINERVAKVEVIVQDHDKEIERLKDDNSLLHRVTATQEQLTKLMEESQQTHKETRQTLKEINENMNKMSLTQEKLQLSQETMQYEITQMKDDINTTNSKFMEIEKKVEANEDKGKFDVVKFFSQDAMKYVLLAIIALILGYFGIVK